MTKLNCKTIQRELDDLMLNEECSVSTLTHLSDCNECREFRDKQRRLREIVGSLRTVAAPADFDFHLRSRLANENSTTGFQVNRSAWSFAQRSVAATLALVILFGALMLVRYVSTKAPVPPSFQVAADNNKPSAPQPAPVAPERLKSEQPKSVDETAAIPKTPRHVRTARESRKQLTTVDSASTGATVIGPDEVTTNETVFPIDTTLQSFKVSLFDGRGNPRTISVPTVSFGSQRVLPVSNQLAPKGIW